MRTRLSVESLTVETFHTMDEPATASDPDTFATTGGPYLCAADCTTDSEPCASSPEYC